MVAAQNYTSIVWLRCRKAIDFRLGIRASVCVICFSVAAIAVDVVRGPDFDVALAGIEGDFAVRLALLCLALICLAVLMLMFFFSSTNTVPFFSFFESTARSGTLLAVHS